MKPATDEVRWTGTPVAPGVTVGRVCLYCHATATVESTEATDVAREESRLDGTLAWMSARLSTMADAAEDRLDADLADIFRAQRVFLEDPNLRRRILRIIETRGVGAEGAVERQLGAYEAQLKAVETEYLRQRAADIAELRHGLISHLRSVAPFCKCGDMENCSPGACPLGNDHIVVTSELTSHLVLEAGCNTRGFVVERGGALSHAAILARALGLPVVAGIEHPTERVPCDARILVDGTAGEVILNPAEETVAHRRGRRRPTPQASAPVPGLRVLANIDHPDDVADAVAARAEGIGVYRTETDVLARRRLLTEQEQQERYTAAVSAMGGKPVHVRMLDLGSDKTAEWLQLPPEENPALGCRGSRLLLARDDLFAPQARALAHASRSGPVHVIYPMVGEVDEFLELQARFRAAVAGVETGTIRHGVMFEVPAACLQAREFFRVMDFGCIGSNDLIQYLLAVDRHSGCCDSERIFDHPALWRLLRWMAEAADEAGKPLAACGELAGNPRYTRKLVESGIRMVSVAPRRIAAIRRAYAASSAPTTRLRPSSLAR